MSSCQPFIWLSPHLLQVIGASSVPSIKDAEGNGTTCREEVKGKGANLYEER